MLIGQTELHISTTSFPKTKKEISGNDLKNNIAINNPVKTSIQIS
jgi:hypothetical protein